MNRIFLVLVKDWVTFCFEVRDFGFYKGFVIVRKGILDITDRILSMIINFQNIIDRLSLLCFE